MVAWVWRPGTDFNDRYLAALKDFPEERKQLLAAQQAKLAAERVRCCARGIRHRHHVLTASVLWLSTFVPHVCVRTAGVGLRACVFVPCVGAACRRVLKLSARRLRKKPSAFACRS